jgi:hypothetical protein
VREVIVCGRERHRPTSSFGGHVTGWPRQGFDTPDGRQLESVVCAGELRHVERSRRDQELVLLSALERVVNSDTGHQWDGIEREHASDATRGGEMRSVARKTIGDVDRCGGAVRR